MKKMKKLLSIILVVTLLSISTIPAYAYVDDLDIDPEQKCSETVVEFLHSSNGSELSESTELVAPIDEEERLSVYVWYKDIDQNEVDAQTKEVTGLTPENCGKIAPLSMSAISKSINFSGSNEEILADYIEATAESREVERDCIETYIMARRQIASEFYQEKSDTIVNTINVRDEHICFKSIYAPMVIADLTAEEIERAANSKEVEIIGYYDESVFEEENIDSAIAITNVDSINAGTSLNLTGSGVKVGLIDSSRPAFSSEVSSGLVLDSTTPTNRTASNGVVLEDYGNVVVVGSTPAPDSPGTSHPDGTSNSLLSVAPNVTLYCNTWNYNYIEAMISDGVKILSLSMGSGVLESSDDYAYTATERWFDHVVSNHNISMLKSGGNNGNHTGDTKVYDSTTGTYKWQYGPRVTSPGMANNLITVGAYHESDNVEGHENTDELFSYSSYKNSVDGKYGCEKPDVVMPANFNGGGTSNATPFLAGIVALMLELKPDLCVYPQAVKAIVLASCHRKVNQSTALGGQEQIEDGITDRQGAGAPDAKIMAAIVCHGTYGVGINYGVNTDIIIEQPAYGAEKMNVSLTWIKENTGSNSHNSNNDITEGTYSNLSLKIYQNNTLIKSSDLSHSSTEMCYFPLSTTDYRYRIGLMQNYSPTALRFGYAWSTDSMRLTPISFNGIFFIRNRASGRYITNDINASNPNREALAQTVTNQNNFSDAHKWILKTTTYGYTLETGYGTNQLFLGESLEPYSNNSLYSTMTSSTYSMFFLDNYDGTYTILNADATKVLTYKSGYMVWETFTNYSSIDDTAKWYFDRVNYLPGDANADGTISILDVTFIQRVLVGLNTATNIQKYLGDANRDGSYDITDTNAIFGML